ncbi:hypothetical protein [Holzapfeliella floricola]|uniref:hypothetical protein n=1 Tax=Holzapfeliella floricola TaxID=679249 RepID=UPI00078531DE|nr:hypothetical protein [Holzapfeliella floricola]
MIYFVNQYLLELNTSIEHTEVKRINLFKQMKIPAKIVTRDFNTMMAENIKSLGLDNDQVLNMYDYFRDTINIPVRVTKKIVILIFQKSMTLIQEPILVVLLKEHSS